MTYYEAEETLQSVEPTRVLKARSGDVWEEKRTRIVGYTATGKPVDHLTHDVRIVVRKRDGKVGIWNSHAGIALGVGGQQFARYRKEGVETRLSNEDRPIDGNRTYHDVNKVLAVGWAAHHGGPGDTETVDSVLAHFDGQPLPVEQPDRARVAYKRKPRVELKGQQSLFDPAEAQASNVVELYPFGQGGVA